MSGCKRPCTDDVDVVAAADADADVAEQLLQAINNNWQPVDHVEPDDPPAAVDDDVPRLQLHRATAEKVWQRKTAKSLTALLTG